MSDTFSISAKELQEALKKKNVTVIDVRSVPEYGEGHIWEAQNFPIEGLPQSLISISKAEFLVTVCNKGGGRSEKAAELLKENGWQDTRWLDGGYMGWVEAGYSDFEAGFTS